ncbi:beta-lactamase family protein [Rufibacter glacialis]|uniref:Beta-lactamase family protein n=1 Tax=Rufibacter glacialis TaxID=1259555 RepID=A0A5M8QKS1_9BACT|nr:beta-lactamase family protein [Rufibacter glacialis]
MRDLPFAFIPGQKYQYNHLEFCLLGAVMARVTSIPNQENLEKELLEPLSLG